jgi:8-oxo-dGTP pyrophosphatase MutT (NUDIX family)
MVLGMTDEPSRWISTGSGSPGRGGDYDPADVPVRNAATVLILDERPDLHVLMLKRNARSVFVGDMWVFPGGAVDDHDATAEADALVAGVTDAECSAALGLASGGIAYWVAVLRETFEEAGVLIATDRAVGEIVDFRDPAVEARFDRHRHVVNTTESAFIDIVDGEALDLDGAGVHYVAQWITPLGPPRRYDTRFFVTAMPAGQIPLHDDDEAVHHEWVRAADALAANERGEMIMMTPTLSMLQRLATFSSADEALASAAASSSADDEWIRIRHDVEGHARIAYPVDADYADADAVTEHGVLRWPAGS